MNNPLDNGDDHNLDSIFNNLIQSLEIDPHQQIADGDVYWDSGGQAGHIEGQKFYNTGDHYIGCLGADMKVYDAHDKCIGWVDTKGHAYTLDGAVFAEGKTPIWVATVLVFNTSSPG